MPEHRIRLRGPWELSATDPTAQPPSILNLPTIWPGESPGRFRLARRFGRPPVEPHDRLRLDLVSVPGLVAVRLNGDELGRDFGHAFLGFVPIPGLLPLRNLVELEVDFRGVDPGMLLEEWGRVALVILTEENPPG